MTGYGKSAGRETFKFWCQVKTEKNFVIGGIGVKGGNLKPCEVIQHIGRGVTSHSNLTMPRRMGSMMLADEKLHVWCGFNSCYNLDLFLPLELSKVVRFTIRP